MTVRKKILTILEAGHYAKDRIDNNLLVFYNPTQDYVVSDTGGCFLEKNFNAYEKSDIEIYLKNDYVYNIGDKDDYGIKKEGIIGDDSYIPFPQNLNPLFDKSRNDVNKAFEKDNMVFDKKNNGDNQNSLNKI